MNRNREKEEDQEEKYRGPKRQRRSPSEIWPAIPPQEPDLPAQFNDKIMELQGLDVKLVIQKELNRSDVSPNPYRLRIPNGQMKNDFLTTEERLRLEEREANGFLLKGLQVPLIDPSLNERTITVKKFRQPTGSCYVLQTPWKEVVITNGLEEGNSIQLWSFRVNERPHLVLVKLEKEERTKTQSGSS